LGERGRERALLSPRHRSSIFEAEKSSTSTKKKLHSFCETSPAVSAAFKRAASALEGLGVQAATINAVSDQGLSKVQGGGAGKTAVRAFFSTLQGAKKGERRPTNVAAGGEALVSPGGGDDGPLADPSAIAAVALEALAAAAASRLDVKTSALLSRSSSSSSSSSSPSSKKDKSKKEEAKKAEKKKKKEEEKKKKEDEKKKTKDSKNKKKTSDDGKKKKRKAGRVNEGGGYFSSSPDIDALGDSTFDANVLSSESKGTMVMF